MVTSFEYLAFQLPFITVLPSYRSKHSPTFLSELSELLTASVSSCLLFSGGINISVDQFDSKALDDVISLLDCHRITQYVIPYPL